MCVVSLVVDASQRQWGNISTWPAPVVVDMSEVIQKLSEIDKKLGARDCYDPKKDEFLQALERRLKAVEAFVCEEKVLRE